MRVRRSLSRILSLTFEAFLALGVLLVPGFGQTAIDLQTQGRNPDFSGMPFTRPVTVGSAAPATCQVGQLFFSSSAAPGSNIFGCTATNIWSAIGQTLALPLSAANGGTGVTSPTGLASGNGNCSIAGSWPNQTISCAAGNGITGLTGDIVASGTGSVNATLAAVNANAGTYGSSTAVPVFTVNAKGLITGVSIAPVSGGGGAAIATQLLDFAPNIAGPSTTFGGSCSASTPCLVYLNGARYVFTSSSTLGASGSANDTIYLYVDTTGTRTAGYNSANTYSPTNLTLASGITAFPQGTYPLYQCTVTAGSFTGCFDYRAILSKTSFGNGQGTAISQSGGIMSINIAETVDAISAANYTVPGTSCGHFEIGTNSSGATWGLPQPGVGGMMTNGCAIAFKASASGAIVLAPSNATINGASSYTIASGHACRVVTDGSNYFTEVCP